MIALAASSDLHMQPRAEADMIHLDHAGTQEGSGLEHTSLYQTQHFAQVDQENIREHVQLWKAHLGLCVYAQKVQVVPDHFHKPVQVPFLVGAHGAVMRQPRHDLQLFQCDLVNLVDHIDGRNVDAAALNDVHKLVNVAVFPHVHVRIVYTIL